MRTRCGWRTAAAVVAAATLVMSGLVTVHAGVAAAAESGELTTVEVESFLGGVVPPLLTRYEVPGAAVSVVSGGQEVFAGGYGFADLGEQRPIDPEDTAFFIASVAKLFTATAVLQQVERGALDLDRDVNTYLDTFTIPDTYPGQPVTLRHLLTHTAGFDGLVLAPAPPTRSRSDRLASSWPSGSRPGCAHPVW